MKKAPRADAPWVCAWAVAWGAVPSLPTSDDADQVSPHWARKYPGSRGVRQAEEPGSFVRGSAER